MAADPNPVALDQRSHVLQRVVRAVLAACLLTFVVFSPSSGSTRLSEAIHNGGHGVTFAIVAWLLFGIGRDMRRFLALSLLVQCFAIWAMATLLGGATELLQIPAKGDASWLDFGNDALGAITGVAAYTAIHALHRARRLQQIALACAAMFVAQMQVWIALAHQLRRDAEFPVIVDYSRRSDEFYTSWHWVTVSRQALPAPWATRADEAALHVQFIGGPWPGASFDEPYPDWSGYSELQMDLTNPMDQTLRLTIRIHDRQHNQNYEDRFNRTFDIPARTRTTLSIPLEDVRSAPAGREMDMRHIAGIVMFRVRGTHPKEFYLSRVELR